MAKQPKIVVGLSGGVDSAVAAFRLKEAGFEVTGLFMKNWDNLDESKHCPYEQDLNDVTHIAQMLDIPLVLHNFTEEYWNNVFTHFLEAYRKGHTPNPDILCNREIKFKAMWEEAQKLGASMLATGHYADIIESDSKYYLHEASDRNKDQTYFLYAINPNILSSVQFPLAKLHKPDVRAIAEKLGLKVHNKKDSTGICFIGERPFRAFLQNYLPNQPGDIRDDAGVYRGKHYGLMYYTLGQRKGLSVGGQKDSPEAPWYVLGKKLSHNELIITQDPNHIGARVTTITVENPHWLTSPINTPFTAYARMRHRQPLVSCTITAFTEEQMTVRLTEPMPHVTPGQSLVLYQEGRCLGGGVIIHTDASFGVQ